MEPGQLECPDCFIRMHRLRLHGRKLYRCLNCYGLWIPSGKVSEYALARRTDNPEAITHIPDLGFQSDTPPTSCQGCGAEALCQGAFGTERAVQCSACEALFLPQSTHDFLFPPNELQMESIPDHRRGKDSLAYSRFLRRPIYDAALKQDAQHDRHVLLKILKWFGFG